MEQRRLGRTGLVVPAIGLGCMGMSFAYGPADESECLRALRKALDLGIGLVAYSPVGRGFLAGAVKNVEKIAPEDFRRSSPRFQGENFKQNLLLIEAVKDLARAKRATPAQIALAWLLRQGPDIVPIPGTTKAQHLEENAGAASIELSEKDWAEVTDIFRKFPVAGARYPESMMRSVSVP